LVLKARDRFGDYGLVGVCMLRPPEQPESSDTWAIDTLLMSCRVLGRGVEEAFLHWIAESAARQGARTLVAPYVQGPRNGQVLDFLTRSGFDRVEPDLWKLAIAELPPLPRHVHFAQRVTWIRS
jgi:FkbH-like protein